MTDTLIPAEWRFDGRLFTPHRSGPWELSATQHEGAPSSAAVCDCCRRGRVECGELREALGCGGAALCADCTPSWREHQQRVAERRLRSRSVVVECQADILTRHTAEHHPPEWLVWMAAHLTPEAGAAAPLPEIRARLSAAGIEQPHAFSRDAARWGVPLPKSRTVYLDGRGVRALPNLALLS